MKKKFSLIFYVLFWALADIFELYCLIALHDDLFSVVAGGLVVLIATYLMLDTMIEWHREEKKHYMNEVITKQNEAIAELTRQIQEIEKYQKALYVYTKRSLQSHTDGKNSNNK